jgi:DNA uptake protein ComE-like DNA-binding protein
MSTLRVYRGDDRRDIPAIDFTPAWQAQGWSTTPPQEGLALVPETEPSVQPIALLEINTASDPEDLVALPSVGIVRATSILENRPPNGYSSLAEAAALNPHGPDWEAIANWEG